MAKERGAKTAQVGIESALRPVEYFAVGWLLLEVFTYAIEVYVFEVECMNVAWKIATLFACVSRKTISKGPLRK